MITIPGREYVGSPKQDVFRAGTHAETWPTVKGMELKPQDPILSLGGVVVASLAIPGVPRIGVEGKVVKCDPGESVLIKGQSKLASVEVGFDLRETEDEDITEIQYVLRMEGKKIVVRLAEPAIREFLRMTMPELTNQYKSNVEQFLLNEPLVA